MSKRDNHSAAEEGAEQSNELVNQGRREALTRFAKYTAPAMLAVLVSTSEKAAATVSGFRP